MNVSTDDVLQLCVYPAPLVPPETAILINPSQTPLHEAFTKLSFGKIESGELTIIETVSEHPLKSVTAAL